MGRRRLRLGKIVFAALATVSLVTGCTVPRQLEKSDPADALPNLACNCNNYEGQTGIVTGVYVGVDDDEAPNVSFRMSFGGSDTGAISVKPTLNDNSGVGMFGMLMRAYTGQIRFTIDRCYSDQLAGAHLMFHGPLEEP